MDLKDTTMETTNRLLVYILAVLWVIMMTLGFYVGTTL